MENYFNVLREYISGFNITLQGEKLNYLSIRLQRSARRKCKIIVNKYVLIACARILSVTIDQLIKCKFVYTDQRRVRSVIFNTDRLAGHGIITNILAKTRFICCKLFH